MNARGFWTVPLAAAAAVVVAAVPAVATTEPAVTVSPGTVVNRDYPPLVGANNDDAVFQVYANNYLAACRQAGPCDVIPLQLDNVRVRQGSDTLVKLVISYDDQGGQNRLSTWLFDPAHEGASDVPLERGPNVPGGRVEFYIADPTLTRYDFVVNNVQGPNTGFHLAASVVTIARPSAPAGRNAATDARATSTRGSVMVSSRGAAPTADATADLSLAPDSRLSGLRSADTRASAAIDLEHLPWWLVLLAALLVTAVAVLWRRAMTTKDGRLLPAPQRRLRDLPLFWKVLTPFVLVMILVGLVGTYITARYLTKQAQSSLDESLVQRSAAADAFLRDQELYELEAVQYAANLVGVPEALAAHNTAAAARSLASAVAVHKELDVLSVVDVSGASVVDYTRSGDRFVPYAGARWSGVRAVSEVLSGYVDAAGDKHTGLVRLANGQTLLVVAAPVRTTRTVGAVVAGIDADRLARGIVSRSGGTVALYDLAGSRMGTSAADLPATIPASWASTTLRHRWTEHGREVASIYAPLVVRGVQVGSVAVTRPVGSTFSHVRGAALQLAALALLAVAVIGALGLVITRYVLTMVRPLLAANRSFGRGDLDVRAKVRSADELGELAAGFNQMADRLQASYEELERRVAQRTEELQRLYDETAADAEARAQFFATVSHELRTPLFAILANAELLTDPVMRPETAAEVEEFTSTIVQSGRVLLDRVNELLDLARLESGAQMRLELEKVRPIDAWRDIAPSMTALARTERVHLEVGVTETLPPVIADPVRLRQIFMNLVSNALKYTPADGSVRVTATASGSGAVELAVADTGVGIPADVGDKVFEPYYQVNRGGDEPTLPSTGLGLAITKRLVDAHGGRMWFESVEGAGTTFHVVLPTAGAGPGAPSQRQPMSKANVTP